MSTEQKVGEEYPLAFASQTVVGEGDRLILILRSINWSERNVSDLTEVLDRIGLEGRYAVLYLDDNDEAHLISAPHE